MNGPALIGSVLAGLIEDQFARDDDRRMAALVRSFTPEEISEFIDRIVDLRVGEPPERIRVAVFAREGRELPERLRGFLADGPLTRYRHAGDRASVLIPLDVPSDAQGLRQMFELQDEDVLAPPSPADAARRREIVMAGAWGDDRPVPRVLETRLDAVFRALSEEQHVSLRVWVDYTIAVCGRARDTDALSGEEVEEVLGDELPRLGLFRDDDLFRRRSMTSDLERNRNLADLRGLRGNEVDQEEVLARIERAEFRGRDDEPLDEQETRRLREGMREYVLSPSPVGRRQAPHFRFWAQAWQRSATRMGVGAAVREELEARSAAALEHYESLELEADLDEADPDAARSLLEDTVEVTDDGLALAEMLSSRLRGRITRIARSDASTADDLLVELLRSIPEGLDVESPAVVEVSLDPQWHQTEDRIPTGTLAVLVRLFGPTLAAAAEQSREGTGARLNVDSRLTSVHHLPDESDEEGAEPDEVELGDEDWGPVHLLVRSGEEGIPIRRIEWDPDDIGGYAALVRLLDKERTGGQVRFPVEIADFAEWCQLAKTRQAVPDLEADLTDAPLTRAWLEERRTHLVGFAERGLSTEAIDAYVEAWREASRSVRFELVPEGGIAADVVKFLDVDTAIGPDRGWAVALSSHPLRLRWFARHLFEIRSRLLKALAGEFRINQENQRFFFDAVAGLSAHRQPASLVAGPYNEPERMLAAVELGLDERYLRESEGNATGTTEVDDASATEVRRVVRDYLDAFPSKVDRLVVLVLSRDGDSRMITRLASEILGSQGGTQVVEFHLVTPRRFHHRLSARLGEIEPDEDTGNRLLPRLRVNMHDWRQVPDLEDVAPEIDVTIIPNLFGTRTRIRERALDPNRRESAAFDPWIDPPVHIEGSGLDGQGPNVSCTLLPDRSDESLENWSTLAVRRYLRAPVGERTGDIEAFAVQVDFDRDEQLFNRLHELSHWVVTLDEYVGREQIDALPDPPDVIMVRRGIGDTRLHTIVVSSRTGREHVCRGLTRKLRHIDNTFAAPEWDVLPERLYDIARDTVPGAVLRALGLGRGVEEILGLVVARHTVQEHIYVGAGQRGATWWIALDDHVDWFGGHRRPRADLVRLSLLEDDRRTQLVVDVVESKFRSTRDVGSAYAQVERSMEILGDALRPRRDELDDGRFWRRAILDAVRSVSRRSTAHELAGFRKLNGIGNDEVDRLLGDLREGEYDLELRGVVCSTAANVDGVVDFEPESPIAKIDIGRQGLLALMRGIRDHSSAPEATTSHEQEPDIDNATPERAEVEAAQRDEDGQGDLTESSQFEEDQESGRTGGAVPAAEGEGQNARGLGGGELASRAQRVIDKLDEHRIAVSLASQRPFTEGPGFYVLRFDPGPGVTVDRVLQRDDDLKLVLGLDATQELRAYVDRGALTIEVPKHDGERYDVIAEEIWARYEWSKERLAVPVGEDIGGRAVDLIFSSPDSPHLMIAGTTGSGKSVALETILLGAVRHYTTDELRVMAVDPKGTELTFLEGDDHLLGGIGLDSHDAGEMLDRAVEEMRHRYELFRERRVRDLAQFNAAASEPIPWWLIVLDEYADLTLGDEQRALVETPMVRIAQRARAAGIHVILATQRPSAEVIRPVIRSNFPAQLALRVRSAVDSRIVIDEGGAEALAGKGDALLRTARSITRVQCAILEGRS